LAAIAAAAPAAPVAAQFGICEVTGYGVDSDRTGEPTNMRTKRNLPCWFNLRFGADSLMLTTPPGNGRVEVQGARVTYTPAPNYLGADHFVLQSRGPMMSTGQRRPGLQFSVAVLVTR
jgi:hypothetical protein